MSLKLKLAGYFVLLSLLPLAAATVGFRAVVTRSETRRVDVRLEAGLRAALRAYDDELGLARRRVDRLANNPEVQKAFQRRDRATLRAAVAATPNVRIVGPGIAPIGPVPVNKVTAARSETVIEGPSGAVIGRIIATVPFDKRLIQQLKIRAGLESDDRLIAIRGDQVVGQPGERVALQPEQPHTIKIAGTRYRALEASPLAAPAGMSLAVLAGQAQIDHAISAAEQQIVLGLLASVLLIALLAYVIGRSIVRSLDRISSAADEIALGRLGVRVDVRGRDEFATLGRAFNSMASQLEYRLEELTTERTRLRDVTTRFGDALAATHDAEHLKRAVVEAAVEATAAEGGLLVAPRGDLVETGHTDVGADRIELPLRAGVEDFGTIVLNGRSFTPEQREVAGSLVTQMVIALENARLHRVVERQALLDGLTGLANRRAADEHLSIEFHRAQRFSAPLAIVLADVDGFKLINDRFGHPTGDAVLRQLAETLTHCVRDIDLAGRWGGEEFILILPGTDAEGAGRLADRVRGALRERPIRSADGEQIDLRASFGVAAYPDAETVAHLVEAADAALYTAKRAGKDRVVIAPAATRRR